MRNRRNLASLVMGVLLALAVTVLPAFAAGETKALLDLVKGSKSNDFAVVDAVAEKARKIGWSIPITGKEFKLIGPWNFTTSKGEKGEIVFGKGGKLTYGKSLKLPFVSWHAYTNGKKPGLLMLKHGKSEVFFQYFQRPGVAVISNIGNRKQWVVMTVK
ncbi:hypothetical protein HDIA_4326 [Hartmannibacter diazotrophicus]|uniref:Uncharacterized protein n=1 Tax=Hartmannibacter diazotrophicus TaxID=1482074 RepID=A0A2C9DC36_9HYPH|nr:hypothetical protein [Hartmannibacter diazotrophicus]SON57867.1 hypothetical protein HDIA_4326 [Hartmannibacter diazotrophicus]